MDHIHQIAKQYADLYAGAIEGRTRKGQHILLTIAIENAIKEYVRLSAQSKTDNTNPNIKT